MLWMLAAVMSAFFAGVTAILSKYGVRQVNSNVVTAIRTLVVFVLAWVIVFITGAHNTLSSIDTRSVIFLVLSGAATGASWLCYFKALSMGDASKVAAVDKSSIVLSVLLAIIIFPEERGKAWIKIALIICIAVGAYFMADIKIKRGRTGAGWLIFALLSAVFAALTSVLAKIGIRDVDSNAATAIRTGVVLIMAWLIVIFNRQIPEVKKIDSKSLIFIILSGIATAASWLCYYYALHNGKISVVVPIDKLSVLVTVVFSLICFKEKLKPRAALGLLLMVAATVAMVFVV